MTAVPHPVRIFRLLHIDNLPVCLQRGGLHAPNYVPNDGLQYRIIHNVDIQNERKLRQIPCGAGGTIHDYVAFYFGMRSPMLYVLHSGRVEGYNEGQEPLIYVVSTVEAVQNNALRYVFSDGQGIAAYTQWYDNLNRLNEVDWATVYASNWACSIDDMDRQRRKQAEFLVYQSCPWSLVQEIGVFNDNVQKKVLGILQKFNVSTPVRIHRDWYY